MNENALEVLSDAEEYALFGYPPTTMQDCDFLESIIEVSGCPSPMLLDIACGSGRHALEMAKRGYSVTGFDISESMVCAAREYAEREGLDVRFEQRDMREMNYDSQFDLAYVLFNTMGLLTTNDALLDFLDGVYAALRPNGLFVFQVGNLWSYIAQGNFSNSLYESEEERGGVKRKLVMRMVIGPYNNIYRMHYDKYYWRDGRELGPKSEDVDLRVFSVNELDLLLDSSGFDRLKVFGATDLLSVIEDPDTLVELEKPFLSYVVLTKKII
jgi:SAM-dependent methyltransferase